jgi:hypothetical protein
MPVYFLLDTKDKALLKLTDHPQKKSISTVHNENVVDGVIRGFKREQLTGAAQYTEITQEEFHAVYERLISVHGSMYEQFHKFHFELA